MSTLAVTVACVTCIVKTGKLPSPPPSVFLRQMFVPLTKLERHPPKLRLIGMPLCMGMPHPGGGDPDQASQALVYHGNCFIAYGNFCSRESPEKRVYAAHVG